MLFAVYRARLADVAAIVAVAVTVVVAGLTASADARSSGCDSRALAELKRLAPAAYAVVYERLEDKSQFTHWITCDDVQLGLTTAVHEGVHMLTHQLGVYPLVDGLKVQRVAAARTFFPPRLLAGRFDPRSSYVQSYLRPGAATSAEEFGYLLDELNAYAHDLDAAVRLVSIGSPDRHVYHRDGLAALMAFVAAYVEEARAANAETWRALQGPVVRGATAALWQQAEEVMGASCRLPNYGQESVRYLTPLCSADIRHGLGALLGRPPRCPVSCLERSAGRSPRGRG